jgi:hypothetical protein
MQVETIDDPAYETIDDQYPVYQYPIHSNLPEGFLDDETGTSEELDPESELDKLVRNVLLNYTYKKVENENDFLSENTVRAFYNDSRIMKRRTERLYYEPQIELFYGSQDEVITTTYESFDGTTSASQKTILLNGGVLPSAVNKVIFGNNHFDIITPAITNVDSEVLIVTNEFLIKDDIGGYLRPRIVPKQQMINFNEVAFFDIDDNIILYTSLPNVIYNSEMYGSFRFDFIQQ